MSPRPSASPGSGARREEHLLLVRHGKAEDSHPLGDGARALTDEGREEFRAHAERIAGHVALRGILTSPLVRAVQTAEILAAACGVGSIEVKDELEAERASARSIEALCRAVGPGWALVGHNPSMAEALAHLIGHPAVPQFRKGAVAALEPGKTLPWRLVWMASPGRKMRAGLD
jgi:phosphohistidine phosphatase